MVDHVTGGDLRQAAIWHGLWAVLPRPAPPGPGRPGNGGWDGGRDGGTG